MSQAHPSVTVSIVSHGQWSLVQPLIDQLLEHCRSSVARILVTENIPEHIPESFRCSTGWPLPIEFIRNATPRGFGANHNQAFNLCRTPWFLVLNPDIRLSRDVISPMLTHANPHAGLLAPRIQEPGKSEPEAYRALLTPAELLRRRSRRHHPPSKPSWVAGMFMLVRSDVYRSLNGFDERFFMYCEDVDLCTRLQLHGWQIQVLEDLSVRHEARRDSHSSLRSLSWHLTSLGRLWVTKSFWQFAIRQPHRSA